MAQNSKPGINTDFKCCAQNEDFYAITNESKDALANLTNIIRGDSDSVCKRYICF